MCLCVLGMCVAQRALEGEGQLCVGSVCLSNGLTSGRRAIDDLIKISRLFFAPLGKGLCCPLLSFSPHLAPSSLPPPSTSSPLFPSLSLLSSLTFRSSPPLLSSLAFKRPEMDHCLHKNGCRSLFISFAFNIALRLSLRSML